MGSRCGTIRYVPFEESWPPTENNLAGPYWARRLEGKGVHAPDYTPAVAARNKYSRIRRGSGKGRRGRDDIFGDNFKMFCACALTFAMIGGCALSCAGCCSEGGGGARGGRRNGGGGAGSKQRGRPQWVRRAGLPVLGARSEE